MSSSLSIAELESQLEKCPSCSVVFSGTPISSIPLIVNSDCGHAHCNQCVSSHHWSTREYLPLDNFFRHYELPTNYAILQHNIRIRGQINKKKQEELEKSAPPAPCVEVASHQATIFCESCSADFCQQCFDSVHKPKVLSSHKKVPLSEKPIQLSKCSKHPHNTSEFLCKDSSCDKEMKLMCHTCLLVDHKDHSYEMLMEKLVENEKKAVEMIEKMAENTKEIRRALESKNQILNTYSFGSKAFEAKSKEISDHFDSLKTTAIQNLRTFVGIEAIEMKSERSEMEELLKKSVEVEKELRVVVKSKRNLESLDAILPKAQEIVDEPVRTETRVPLDKKKISWKNGTELELEVDENIEKHWIP